jgi:hypothetical protein
MDKISHTNQPRAGMRISIDQSLIGEPPVTGIITGRMDRSPDILTFSRDDGQPDDCIIWRFHDGYNSTIRVG